MIGLSDQEAHTRSRVSYRQTTFFPGCSILNVSFTSHKRIISKNKVSEVSVKEQIFIFVGNNRKFKTSTSSLTNKT
jgi:hypothetical protein